VDGIIATRELTDGAYALALSQAEDEPEIRRLLRESAFAGSVRLSLEREPDSRLAAWIEGDLHETIVVRHRKGDGAVAIASRSVRSAFLNGAPTPLGYLGQLRIDQRYRRRRGLLDAGFRFARELHERHARESNAAPRVYLASVVADNLPARRLLARRVTGWPTFEPMDTLVSLAIPLERRPRPSLRPGLELRRGGADLVDDIVACLNRNGRRFQFFPAWTRGDLLSPMRTRGLAPEDFVVALRDGRAIGCAACWDQRAFKQVRVRGYARGVAPFRPVLNLFSPALGVPRLPPVGAQLQNAYVSHLAIDEDQDGDGSVLTALVKEVGTVARSKRADYVLFGMSSRDAALSTIRHAFRHRAYESILYVAFWPDGEPVARALDGRPSNPELAIL
jgi:hypothetical protein